MQPCPTGDEYCYPQGVGVGNDKALGFETIREGYNLKPSLERRKHKRFIYETRISYVTASNVIIQSGKMFNFSSGGLYFKSDQRIHPGKEIFIGLAGHTDSSASALRPLFNAKIIWRKALEGSTQRYGYGGKFLNSADSSIEAGPVDDSGRQASPAGVFQYEREYRQHTRRGYNKTLRFFHRRIKHHGLVVNIGRGGAFILTQDRFAVGRRITLVVPGIHTRKEVKISGRIVRLSPEGIGVRFEKRSGRERRADLDRRAGSDRRGWGRQKE